MAADKRVNVIVAGDSSGAQRALADVGAAAEGSAKKAGSAFKTMASTLASGSGGALEPLVMSMEAVSRGFDTAEEHGRHVGGVLMGVGAAGVAAGAMLTAAAEKDTQAQQQLDQAISNTGQSVDDYAGRIDDMVHHNERFGDTAAQSEQALRTLVQATGDTGRALDLMGIAADLAAAKHESLGTATEQLAKIQSGKGGRILQEFGINLDNLKGAADKGGAAIEELGQKLSGQASAASDTFGGKLRMVKAVIEDNVASLGQKYGPALMGVSAAATITGGTIEGVSSIVGRFSRTTAEAGQAAEVAAEAETALGGAGLAVGVGVGAAAAAAVPFVLAMQDSAKQAAAAKSQVDALDKSFQGFAGSADAARDKLNKSTAAVVEASTFSQHNIEIAQRLGLTIDDLNGFLDGNTAAMTKVNAASREHQVDGIALGAVLAQVTSARKSEADALIRQASEQELVTQAEADAMRGSQDYGAVIGDLKQRLEEHRAATDDTAAAMKATTANVIELGDAEKVAAAQTTAQKEAFDALNGATSGVAGEYAAAKDSANAFKNALDEVHSSALNAFDSETKVAKATDDLTDALKKDGDNLDLTTAKTEQQRAKVEDLRDATSKAANAALDHAQAMVASGSSAEEAQGFIDNFTASLDQQFRKAGASEAQIADLNKTLGLTPENKATTMQLLGAAEAKAAVDDYLQNHVGKIPGSVMTQIQAAVDAGDYATAKRLLDGLALPRSVTYTINTVTSGGPGFHPPAVPGAATGGSFDTGAEVLVGERGPERVIFGQPGTVIPHGQSALGGGVNITNHFTIQGNVYADDLGAQIEAHLGSVVQQAMAGAR